MSDILINFMTQILLSIGIPVLAGLLIFAANKFFYKCVYTAGSLAVYFTAVIGTPVHELSHALMCLLFGHRIVEMKLFTMSKEGCLGYVNHAYNKKNFYHQIGNFFIGVAPVVLGALVVMLLLRFLAEGAFVDLSAAAVSFNANFSFQGFWVFFRDLLFAVFNPANFLSPPFWVFLILSAFIALHMTLSPADIKMGAKGFFFVLVALLLIDIVLFFLGNALSAFTAVVVSFASYLTAVLSLALVIALVLALIALPIGVLRKRI